MALQNGVFYIILYTFAIHLKDGFLYNYFEGTAATSTVAQQLLLDLGMFFKLSKDLQNNLQPIAYVNQKLTLMENIFKSLTLLREISLADGLGEKSNSVQQCFSFFIL